MYNVDKLVLNYIKEKKGMSKYDDVAVFWNDVFDKKDDVVPTSSGSGNYEFDQGLRWLSKNVNTILDFGCGNGTVLFWCSSYGTKKHIGIDLSEKAILNAKRRSLHMKNGEFQFICGEIDELKHINTGSVEAVILSNIVDNLYPEDAEKLLIEVKRILVENGKIFVKLNPYITETDIKENNIKVIGNNVLDDGLILWNNTTEQWHDFFEQYFSVFKQYDIHYAEYKQYNRIFLLTK